MENQMINFEDFEELFSFDPDIAYNEQAVGRIIRSRRSMENELFVDRLLGALGIDQASKQYPPRSNQNLRDLHQQICESASPDHHKQSLFYYILKDIPSDSLKQAEAFAKSCFLPEKYRIFMDGIWCLDRGRFERALDYLTEPVLTPTFPEEILYTLCTHPDQKDPTLPIAYYQTVTPPITSYKVLETYFSILCRLSVTGSFLWYRKQGEPRSRRLFERLIDLVLSNPEDIDRSSQSVELINLPLSQDEESWLSDHLTEGKGRNLPGAKDTLMMRSITTGRLSKFSDESKGFTGRTVGGINWATVKEGMQQSSMLAPT